MKRSFTGSQLRSGNTRGRLLPILVIALCVCNAFGGCSRRAVRDFFSLEESRPGITYRVRSEGETLAAISRRYTGSASNWRLIRAENPGLNPRRLQIGEVIVIPARLTKRRLPDQRAMLAAPRAPASRAHESSLRPAAPVGRGLETASGPETSMQDEVFRERLIEAVLTQGCGVPPAATEP